MKGHFTASPHRHQVKQTCLSAASPGPGNVNNVNIPSTPYLSECRGQHAHFNISTEPNGQLKQILHKDQVNNEILLLSRAKTIICMYMIINARCWPGVDIMLDQRLRRWPNIIPTPGQRIVLFSNSYKPISSLTITLSVAVSYRVVYLTYHTLKCKLRFLTSAT